MATSLGKDVIFMKNLHLKDRFLTIFFFVAMVLIGVGIFIGMQVYEKKDVLFFAYNHPHLVSAFAQKYASGSAELDQEMIKSEKTAQDKLIEAVADEVSLR